MKIRLALPAALVLCASTAIALPDAGEESSAAQYIELMLRGELPSVASSCEAASCAEGCTEECLAWQEKYQAKLAKSPMEFYATHFAQDGRWDDAARVVEERFGKASSDERRRLLDLVSYVPAGSQSELPARLWKADKESFTVDHLIGFALAASENQKLFTKVLSKVVKKTNEAEGFADIRPALYFAMHGDARGKATLTRMVEAFGSEGCCSQGADVIPTLLAAKGLEILGEAGVLASQRERVLDATVAALDAGELPRARRMAAQAEAFSKLGAKAYTQAKKAAKSHQKWAKDPLAGWRKALWCASPECAGCDERAAELASADDVLRLLEEVTPL